MLLSAGFALFLLAVVAIWFLKPKREHCPQCHAARDPDSPLCRECGWIYEVPGEADDGDDDGDAEVVEFWN